jgi:hypothetical protein
MKAAGFAALAIVIAAGTAEAGDISAKKMQVKMHDDAAKKQFQVFSSDASITYTDAVAPGTDGASIHIYSATDDLCYVIPGGSDWTEKVDKSWKYKNPLNKNQVQISDGKLQVKLRSGVALSLNNPEGDYNVQITLGDAGEKFCLHCEGATEVIRDDEKKWQGKECTAKPCDLEPGGLCNPTVTTTSSSTTTSTTLPALPGTILKAVLTQSTGNFSYAGGSGLTGAQAQCTAAFAGTHPCSITDLQAAQAAGDLDHIKDPDDDVVTSFWAIDSTRPHTGQCGASDVSGPDWTYATGHLGVGGDFALLNNNTGMLDPVSLGGGVVRNCNGAARWVGCCQ